MSTPSKPIRKDLEELATLIYSRLSRIHHHISSDNPTQTNRWASELTECRRLEDRFKRCCDAYPPEIAARHYHRTLMMDKEKELFVLINKLYDVTTNLYLDAKNYAEDLRRAKGLKWTDDRLMVSRGDLDDVDLISTSSDDEPEDVDESHRRGTPQQQAIQRLQSQSEDDRRGKWAGMLLKIAHQLYQWENFNHDEEDSIALFGGTYIAPRDDQEDQDVQRAVYQVLGGSDKLKEIRERPHVAAMPMRDWEKRIEELVNASHSSS